MVVVSGICNKNFQLNPKQCVFTGPEIRKLMNDKLFEENLNPLEKEAWNKFCLIFKNFLGNKSSLWASIIQDFFI